jgi:hypothetical protein
MVRNAAPASLTLRPGEEQGTWPALRDLAVLLAAEAGGLARRLARPTADAAGELVRGMNCYRSNLIEGHDTRTIDIERYADPKSARIEWMSRPYLALTPNETFTPDDAARLLKRHERFECWRKEQIPARLAFGKHPRIPPIFCLADNGWVFVTGSRPERYPLSGGAHGFDPAHPDMDGLFVAAGPSFRRATTLPPFDNIHVHPLMMHLLGLKSVEGDASLEPVRGALRKGP